MFIQIINTELFKCLKQTHGQSYKSFMLSKLVPVLGNICETNLGIDPILADEIANEVDIIVNSAANTTFDERLLLPYFIMLICYFTIFEVSFMFL